MKVFVLFVEGFEEIEALTPVDILRRSGCDVKMISATGNIEVVGGKGIKIVTDFLFEEIDFYDAEMIILPGGPGTDNYYKYNLLLDAVKKHTNEGKLTAAICAAPKILSHLGLLQGQKGTCYPGVESQLHDAIFTKGQVVEDGQIITANGVGSALLFSLTLVKKLKGEAIAKEIAEKVVAI